MTTPFIHRADSHDELSKTMIDKDNFFQIKDVYANDFPNRSSTIFELDSNNTVDEALVSLSKFGVLSAPVWDNKNKKYLGLLDVQDILSIAIGVDLLISMIPENMVDRFAHPSEESKIKISSFFDENEKEITNKWCPCYPTTPLLTIIKLLATETRRVPILSPDTGRVIQIISQSAVVGELWKHILQAGPNIPNSLNITPRQSGIGTKQVITIREDQPAKDAFALMIQEAISAVGVVDYGGHLLTCITSKDIRLLPSIENSIKSLGHGVLGLQARQYISHLRRQTELTGKARPTIVTCSLDTPMRIIIGKLAETKMHRIFLLGDKDVPAGVISVSDILQLLLEEQIFVTE